MPSTTISLHDLEGTTLEQKLSHYLETHAANSKMQHLITPLVIPFQAQRGESCKLAALGYAIGHAGKKEGRSAIPVYKDKTYPFSLRQIAKKISNSQVGEMYSLEALMKVSLAVKYQPRAFKILDEQKYIETLDKLVHKNFAPVVFFDVEKGSGAPYIGDGRNEHAAIIAACYTNKNGETHFLVTHWGRFFDFDGIELAASACKSLVEKREPETFVKVKQLNGKNIWHLKSRAAEFGEIITSKGERMAAPIAEHETPLKGCFMVIEKSLAPAPSRFFSEADTKMHQEDKSDQKAPPDNNPRL